VKISESVIKIVKVKQAKVVVTLAQKGMEIGNASWPCAFVVTTSPGQEQAPKSTYFSKRNVVSPYGSQGDSEPQGEPKAVRVEEGGVSERWAVMAQIRVETPPGTKVSRLPLGFQ